MEKKNVTNTAKIALLLFNIGSFALAWVLYYNKRTFDTYLWIGGCITILLYSILYNSLCQVYKAFRIASFQITETLFSQLLCFGIADCIFFVECCLVYNRYTSIFPMLAALFCQCLGSAFIIMYTKQYFIKKIAPKTTLFIYGDKIDEIEITSFKQRILQKYEHLFQIKNMLSESQSHMELFQAIDQHQVILLYEVSQDNRNLLMQYAIQARKSIYITPSLSDILLQGCSTKHLLDTPLVKYDYAYERRSGDFLKRVTDIVASLAGLVITLPIMLCAALAIKLEDHGPVFFKQERCTKDGKVFEIVKFRSMIVDAEKNGFVPCVGQDNRITHVGRFLRKTRIDELPQLINILKGDMSLVGPRPERVEHVQKYTQDMPEFAYRLRVKGGLTGYAQIFGKYNTSPYDKLRLDLMYIENRSIVLDMKLIMLTLKIIFTPESTEGFSKEKSQELQREFEKQQLFHRWENNTRGEKREI